MCPRSHCWEAEVARGESGGAVSWSPPSSQPSLQLLVLTILAHFQLLLVVLLVDVVVVVVELLLVLVLPLC